MLYAFSRMCTAASICHVDMTYAECVSAIEAAAAAQFHDIQRENKSDIQRELATVNTGPQTGVDTATEDFNPRLQASVDTLGASADDAGALTLSWNDMLRDWFRSRFFGNDGSAESAGQHHKLTVKLEEPALFEPLRSAITDPALISAFEDELGDFDDVIVGLSFTPASETYGRDLQRHAALIDAVQRDALSTLRNDQAQLAKLEFQVLTILAQSGSTAEELDETKPIRELFSDLSDAQRFVVAIEAAVTSHLSYVSRFDSELRESGFYDLVDLVNNQPQFIFSIQGRARDELVGPDEFSAKITYELGSVNLNRYRKYAKTALQSSATGGPSPGPCATEATCLQSYTERNDLAIRQGNRISLSLEYAEMKSYELVVPATVVDLPSERSFVGSLSYGRYINEGVGTFGLSGRTRIDLSASYEDVSSDPLRQDRAIVNATLAQEIGSGLFLTIGAVWASKPEFRGEVDTELSARAGLSYKLARDNQ
ncbi:MAG: hypothetical protein ACREQZ_09435 [Woeseiaceae bacterium]